VVLELLLGVVVLEGLGEARGNVLEVDPSVSRVPSKSLTWFWLSASRKNVLSPVTRGTSGLTWKRWETTTISSSRDGTRYRRKSPAAAKTTSPSC